jgi:hypothetical protein
MAVVTAVVDRVVVVGGVRALPVLHSRLADRSSAQFASPARGAAQLTQIGVAGPPQAHSAKVAHPALAHRDLVRS